MKIKTGDKVKIIAGKDKGVEAVVEKVLLAKNKLVIEGVNNVKKHIKGTKDKKGGIITVNKPVNASNVMLICPKCSKPTRVAYSDVDSVKHRVCRKCKEVI